MDDVRMALEDADLTPPVVAMSAVRPRRRRVITAAVGVLAAAAGAGIAWWMKPPPEVLTPILTRLTIDPGLTTDPALSSDGRFIAFASDRAGDGNLDLWVRQVAGGDPVRRTKDPSDDVEPSFSPEGSGIAFRSDRDDGGVYVISALGGDARRIAEQDRRPRWAPRAERIAYWTGLNTGFLMSKADAPRLFVVAAGGGESQRLFRDFAVASSPIWSADGTRLLFVGSRDATDHYDWWVANADGSSPV